MPKLKTFHYIFFNDQKLEQKVSTHLHASN